MDSDKFAALVRERLMDTDQVREALGLRNRQSVRDRVEAGKLPPPIILLDRGYAFWDRLDVEQSTRR